MFSLLFQSFIIVYLFDYSSCKTFCLKIFKKVQWLLCCFCRRLTISCRLLEIGHTVSEQRCSYLRPLYTENKGKVSFWRSCTWFRVGGKCRNTKICNQTVTSWKGSNFNEADFSSVSPRRRPGANARDTSFVIFTVVIWSLSTFLILKFSCFRISPRHGTAFSLWTKPFYTMSHNNQLFR